MKYRQDFTKTYKLPLVETLSAIFHPFYKQSDKINRYFVTLEYVTVP